MTNPLPMTRSANTQPSTQPNTSHHFLVTVTAANETQASQVMDERLLFDEDYGFAYTVTYRPLPP